MTVKHILRSLLKKKITYAVIFAVLLINSAFRANEDTNSDLVNAYYSTNHASVVAPMKINPRKVSSLRNGLVDYASKQIGKPYKYASKGPSSFDCSGFTIYVYKNFDIKLPASSKLQARHGSAIDLEDALPGDLLIFKSPSKGNNNVGHVGMVVSNDERGVRFIHSSTGRGVIIDNLTKSKHYTARFMQARRIIDA